MASAYSRRFLIAAGTANSYTPPAGKRAVVKCISASNGAAAVGWYHLSIAGTRVLETQVPAGSGNLLTDVMVVVEAGEVLLCTPTAGLITCVSGYLLDAV